MSSWGLLFCLPWSRQRGLFGSAAKMLSRLPNRSFSFWYALVQRSWDRVFLSWGLTTVSQANKLAIELAWQHLGYMPEHADLYPHLTCRELAETVTALRGAASDVWLEWLTPLGLQGMEDVRLGTMSAGQQRKVTLILALCGEPTLLLLDEPTKALDEASREFLKEVIQKKRERSLIVITSHLKEYLQTHCTHFLRMKDGRNEALETELR